MRFALRTIAGTLLTAFIVGSALASRADEPRRTIVFGAAVSLTGAQADTPEFRAALGSAAQGVLGSAQWSPAVSYLGAPGFYRTAQDYAAAFKREVGHAPDYHDAEATAAGLAFAYALRAAHSTNPGAVRDALARLNVMTFFGQIKFDARGINMYKPMVVNQIQGANVMTIYPYRLANARPLYPAPHPGGRETAAQQ